MPWVIFRWSLDLVFIIFVTIELDPGQCPFTLDDAFFPVAHGGKMFLNCVGETAVLFDAFSLLPMGVEKNLEGMWVRLLSIGSRDCILEKIVSCLLWMGGSLIDLCGSVVICDKLPYIRFYGFGIISLMPTDYNI